MRCVVGVGCGNAEKILKILGQNVLPDLGIQGSALWRFFNSQERLRTFQIYKFRRVAQSVYTDMLRLESRGFETRWGRDNPGTLIPGLMPNQPPAHRLLGLIPWVSWPGRGAVHSPPSRAEVMCG